MEMETQRGSRVIPGTGLREDSGLEQRPESRTSQALLYASQVEDIKLRFGDIEVMRKTLGLSRRQIAQLLMVDPSAWTRWTKRKKGAPPHIYRALEWLMTLEARGKSDERLTGVQEFRFRSELKRESQKVGEVLDELHSLKAEQTTKAKLKWSIAVLSVSQLVSWAFILYLLL